MELYPVARDWATLDTERSLPSPMTSDTEQDRVTPSELSETGLFFSSQRSVYCWREADEVKNAMEEGNRQSA